MLGLKLNILVKGETCNEFAMHTTVWQIHLEYRAFEPIWPCTILLASWLFDISASLISPIQLSFVLGRKWKIEKFRSAMLIMFLECGRLMASTTTRFNLWGAQWVQMAWLFAGSILVAKAIWLPDISIAPSQVWPQQLPGGNVPLIEVCHCVVCKRLTCRALTV